MTSTRSAGSKTPANVPTATKPPPPTPGAGEKNMRAQIDRLRSGRGVFKEKYEAAQVRLAESEKREARDGAARRARGTGACLSTPGFLGSAPHIPNEGPFCPISAVPHYSPLHQDLARELPLRQSPRRLLRASSTTASALSAASASSCRSRALPTTSCMHQSRRRESACVVVTATPNSAGVITPELPLLQSPRRRLP